MEKKKNNKNLKKNPKKSQSKTVSKKERNIPDLLIKLILVLIIIILFLHNCSLMKNNNVKPINGGNINIIEIKCDNSRTCEPVDPGNNGGNNKENKGNKGNKQDDDIIYGDDLIVYDKEIQWDGVTEAKIFTDSMYQLNGIIAPESSSTYQFVVKNGTEYNLKYNVTFIEDNPYNVNMKYKLKRNDTYIIDEYVSASELVAENIILPINNNDTFYLEWKWVSSSNDTEIGKIDNANYGLKIEVKAESVNG